MGLVHMGTPYAISFELQWGVPQSWHQFFRYWLFSCRVVYLNRKFGYTLAAEITLAGFEFSCGLGKRKGMKQLKKDADCREHFYEIGTFGGCWPSRKGEPNGN